MQRHITISVKFCQVKITVCHDIMYFLDFKTPSIVRFILDLLIVIHF